jgi:hypothetical protein
MKRKCEGHSGSTDPAPTFALLTIVATCAMALLSMAGGAFAGDNALLGTWKLKSFVRQDISTGERRPALGEHPEGYLGYAPDGRMYALFAAGGRVVPVVTSQPTRSGSNCA